ncbi:hypothetical protein [Pyrodictium delaneyi]|uniref:Uncharacterized protein n=1 Tax=Pyrodictium delaneyi TaxID=1273541 RepID=A0A211YPP3_9CREN|nr:hypothetical protein [Pyrodictium delaneyi]OWJ54960.1 hypothetical protein Pdsh_04505 [Pyrodictium delaneyi]
MEPTGNEATPGNRREMGSQNSRPRRHKLLLLAVATAVVVAAAAIFILHTSEGLGGQASAEGIYYPEMLPGDYTVERIVSGEEALAAVKGIHWEPGMVKAKKALIVVYSDGTRLWIVDTGDNACELVDRMAEKMKTYADQLPYTAPFSHEVAGVTVYISQDKRDGRLHVFWCRGSLAVWAELGAAAYARQGAAIDVIKTLIERVHR